MSRVVKHQEVPARYSKPVLIESAKPATFDLLGLNLGQMQALLVILGSRSAGDTAVGETSSLYTGIYHALLNDERVPGQLRQDATFVHSFTIHL